MTEDGRGPLSSIERTHAGAAIDETGEEMIRLKADEESGSGRINVWLWDAATLKYVRMGRFASELATFMDELKAHTEQLKIMNIHLASLSGTVVKVTDIDPD